MFHPMLVFAELRKIGLCVVGLIKHGTVMANFYSSQVRRNYCGALYIFQAINCIFLDNVEMHRSCSEHFSVMR